MLSTTLSASPPEPSLPPASLDDNDLEQQRILAAASAALFGSPLLRVGHYRILRRLGSGGMGEVFLAHDEVLDRQVAIKLLRSELTRMQPSELLEREARMLARLSHPHVVQVHELGRHGERAYLVMEYVEGHSLARWLAEARPSWRVTVEMMRAAGEGLAAAHALGLVHRDVKPDNLVVDDNGRPRLVDFGLALSKLDSTASFAGTPRYMAPEQLMGEGVDARSDQFGFCVTLAEALWNVPLRDAEAGPPPSVVPRWLWRVVRRGLRADPERRWPDMPALLQALDPQPRRRKRVALTLGLAGALAGSLWPTIEVDPCATRDRELDAAPWTTARAGELDTAASALGQLEAQSAGSLIDALDRWASHWRSARMRSCRAAQRGELVESRERCLARQARKVELLVELALAQPESLVVHAREAALGLPDPSACELDDPSDVGPSPTIAREVEGLRELADRAAAARLFGQAQASLPALEQGLEHAERLGYLPLIAELQAELGSTHWLAGSPEQALTVLEQAARTAFVAGNDRLAARLWLELGGHAAARSELERARDWLERADDAWARVGLDTGARAQLDYVRGSIALDAGELALADRSLHAALAGPDSNLRPFVLERLAELAEQRGDDDSLELRVRARTAASEVFGPEHPRTAQQRYNLGIALFGRDRPDEARVEFDHAIASWQRAHVQPHEDLAEAFNLAAFLAVQAGEFDGALTYAKRARAIATELEDRYIDARAWTTLGVVHQARSEPELAMLALERAHRGYDQALGPSDPESIKAVVDLGASLLELGHLERARAIFEGVLMAVATPDLEIARITAKLGLAEIELQSEQPERARDLLVELEVETPLDRLDLAILLALAELRLAGEPNTLALAHALAETGEPGRTKLAGFVTKLAIDESERARLGI